MIIAIISSSVRTGRNSNRVALFFKSYITENNLATVDLLDLNDYKFPIFEERLSNMKDPLPILLQFAEKIKNADAVIIVTPEYNGGYPASLKNAIDVLQKEWKRKPVALATASSGVFGGILANISLVISLWKLGVYLVPALYPGPLVQENYASDGTPKNIAATRERAKVFIEELLWCMNRLKSKPEVMIKQC